MDTFGSTVHFSKGNLQNSGDAVLVSSKNFSKTYYIATPDPHFFEMKHFDKQSFIRNTYSYKPDFQPHIFIFSLTNHLDKFKQYTDTHVNIDSSTKDEFLINLTKTKLWLKNRYFVDRYSQLRSYHSHVKKSFLLISDLEKSKQTNLSFEVFQFYLTKYLHQQKKGIIKGYAADINYLKKHSTKYFPEKTMIHINDYLFGSQIVKNFPAIIDEELESLYGKHLGLELNPSWNKNSKYYLDDVENHITSVIDSILDTMKF